MTRTIFLMAAAAGAALAVQDTETIRQTYPAAARLEVRNINGAVRVTASNTGNVQLVATKRMDADNQAALDRARTEVRLDIEQSGDHLRICVVQQFEDCRENRNRRHWGDWDRDYEAKMDLELQIPVQTEVDLKTVNGGITLNGTHGAFQVKTVNGGVTITDLDGSGSAATVNGPLSLSFSRAPRDPIDAKTVNGSIEASFPKAFRADLQLKTFQGDVFTNIPASAAVEQNALSQGTNRHGAGRRNRQFTVRVNGGGPQMHFQTLTGNIQISER